MDKITEMNVFIAAVTQGSFSAAARALDMTPSAVSKQIKRLEDRLGVELFHRTTRRISLTEPGQEFFARCERILAEIEAAEEAAGALQHAVRGTLRVSATATFTRMVVLPRISPFLEAHPELSLELELTDRRVDVLQEGWDVAIRLSEQLDDPTLVGRRLAANERVICAAPEYLRRHGTPRSPEQLLAHNCLTLYTVSRFNDWSFTDAGGSRVLHVGGNLEANSADALYHAALAGVGLARLSTWLVAEDVRAGRLVPVLPEYRHADSAFFVLYPPARQLSRKVRVFVDFLVELFQPAPPWER